MEVAFIDRPRQDLLQKIGFILLLFYFFVAYSRVLDITVPSFRIPMMTAAVMYTTTILCGGIQRSLSSRAGALYFALTGWLFCTIPFAYWRSNTLETLMSQWMKTFPLFIAIAGAVYLTRDVYRLIYMVAVALTVTCVVALLRGDDMEGRLIIAQSKFGDPNDLALFCLLGLGSWGAAIARSRSMFRRALMMVPVGIISYALAMTGSRGAMVGLGVVLVYLFWRASVRGKMLLLFGVVVIVVSLPLLLPRDVVIRYTTFWTTVDSAQVTAGTVGSTESRWYLLKRSIYVTFTNPIFGVGPGNFMAVENDIAQAEGLYKGAWHVTHNMYTQLSSEAGIPALLLCLGIIVVTWKTANRIENVLSRDHPDAFGVRRTAFWLKAMIVTFCSAGFFLSIAYQDVLPLLAGVVMVFERAVMYDISVYRSTLQDRAVSKAPETPVMTGARVPVTAGPSFARPRYGTVAPHRS